VLLLCLTPFTSKCIHFFTKVFLSFLETCPVLFAPSQPAGTRDTAVVSKVSAATQSSVTMGPRIGREGTPSEQCLVAQKPGKIKSF